MPIVSELMPLVTTMLNKGGPHVAYMIAFSLGTALNLLILGIYYIRPIIELVRHIKDGDR